MVKCICINDNNKPKDFPKEATWVVKDMEYHIIRIEFRGMSNKYGVQLNEIHDEDLAPYFGWFALERFAVPKELEDDLEELKRATREEKEFEINIEELLKTPEYETV